MYYNTKTREEITEYDLENQFRNYLEECYPEQVNICWTTMYQVDILEKTDPIAYRGGYLDWIDDKCKHDNLMECSDKAWIKLNIEWEKEDDFICN